MDYNKLIFLFIVSTIFSFLISPSIINALYYFKVWKRKTYIQDIENQAQKKDTPMMGGLIFILGTIIITIFFNLDREYTYIPIGVMLISSTLGFCDDLISVYGRARTLSTIKDSIKSIFSNRQNIAAKSINFFLIPWRSYASLFSGFNSSDRKELFPHERIFIYFLCGALVAWWFYFKINLPHKEMLWLPFSLSINIGWLIIPFIIITVIGTTTAVSITDGLDGLLASLAIPAFSSFGVIALILREQPIAFFCATLVGSLCAYLYFNIKPARVWMGDTGAVALGATLATIAVLLNRPLLILVIGLLFIIDFLSSFIQVYGVKIFHKRLLPYAPIHHWFEKIGWDESKIVMRASIFAWILAVMGVWLSVQ